MHKSSILHSKRIYSFTLINPYISIHFRYQHANKSETLLLHYIITLSYTTSLFTLHLLFYSKVSLMQNTSISNHSPTYISRKERYSKTQIIESRSKSNQSKDH